MKLRAATATTATQKWEGPIQIGNLTIDQDRPPECPGIYVFSERKWIGEPKLDAEVRYVGKAGNLRRRLGEAVAVLLGFGPIDELRYFHGRARRIFRDKDFCDSQISKSSKYFIGWRSLATDECIDCEELKLFKQFHPTGKLSYKKEPHCSRPHHPRSMARK